MDNPRTLFFLAFLDAIIDVEAEDQEQLQCFRADLISTTSGLDPMAAVQYAEKKLSALSPDVELLSIFDAIRSFQDIAFGEGFVFEDNHELVTITYQNAIRLSGQHEVPLSFATRLAEHLRTALTERASIEYLKYFIQQKTDTVNDYRIKKLEDAAAIRSDAVNSVIIGATPDTTSAHEFTLARQALAIHYLVHEALGVSGVDTTKIIALAHLLSAKKIPQKAGKDNLDNSGIKTAFRNMWLKEDKNHLADLHFVLRFLKPLDTGSADAIGKAIKSIERRIEKVSEKLSRDND